MNEELDAMAVRALRRIDMWQELQIQEMRRCCEALDSIRAALIGIQATLELIIDRAQPPSDGAACDPPTGE